MPIFEVIATFPSAVKQKPAQVYVHADTADLAVQRLRSQGASDMRVVRQLSKEEEQQFRFLRRSDD
jgi:hypothetical protein